MKNYEYQEYEESVILRPRWITLYSIRFITILHILRNLNSLIAL